jgi:hypothetical protein
MSTARCTYASSGCNGPAEGECAGLCVLHTEELHGEDAQLAKATAMAGELTLQPMVESEQQRVNRVLGSKERDDMWAKVRSDVRRGQLAELNGRPTTNLGLWA